MTDVNKDGASTALERISVLRSRLAIRADTLPADLALAGLLDDLLGAATAAMAMVADQSTAVAYPLTRIAFEAAQRAIVLATDEHYLSVGTRAWLYYHRKDAGIMRRTDPEAAARWYDQAVTQLRDMWTPYNGAADETLRAENALLEEHERKRRTDNFMGQDLAEVIDGRYPLFLGQTDVPLAEMKKLNRGIYAGLSRESHARMRVEAAAFVVSGDGTVQVVPRSIDETGRRQTLLGCLEASLNEAAGALSYFFERRQRLRAERMQRIAKAVPVAPLRPGFKPDLGLQLARIGGGRTTFHFLAVPIFKLGILPDGSVRWCANVDFGDEEYMATFDVPASLRDGLAECIGLSPDTLRPSDRLALHALQGPPHIGVECVLGDLEQPADEAFVPLTIKRVKPANVT